MPEYNSIIELACYYFGTINVEAQNEEEAKEKIQLAVDNLFGTEYGRIRIYTNTIRFKEDGITIHNFNLIGSEYNRTTLTEITKENES